MKVLGLDTTGESFSVALVDAKRCLCELSGFQPRSHLTMLAPSIELALRLAGLRLTDLDGIAVTVGPGSFTGVRLGVLTAKTLAQARGLPVAAVDALEAVALNHPFAERLVVAHDARRNEVFTATYSTATGRPELLEEPAALGPEPFRARLIPGSVVAGTAPLRCPALFSDMTGIRILPESHAFPRGESVARLGAERLEQGAGLGWLELTPIYLRPAEVQVQP